MTPIRLSKEDYGLKIYSKFPPKYREDDSFQNYSLKRFLQALADGGFSYIIEDTNGLLDLHNPDVMKSGAILPLYEQFGLQVFNGIPEEYLRSLLPHLGEAWMKKGSTDVIKYVTGTLSGINTLVNVVWEKEIPVIEVRLEMDSSRRDYFPNSNQFEKILENFLPYYCDLLLIYSYIFYEKGYLNALDVWTQEDIKVEIKYDDALILNADGQQRLAPTLNNRERLTNDSLLLNGEYTPNYYIDSFNDNVIISNLDTKSVEKNDYSYLYENKWFMLNQLDYSLLNESSLVVPSDFNYITQNGETNLVYFTKDKIIVT